MDMILKIRPEHTMMIHEFTDGPEGNYAGQELNDKVEVV